METRTAGSNNRSENMLGGLKKIKLKEKGERKGKWMKDSEDKKRKRTKRWI